MEPSVTSAANWVSWLISVAIVALFIFLAFVSRFILERIVPIITRRTRTNLDDYIVHALVAPVFAILIAGGVWIGISRISDLIKYLPTIHKIFQSIFTVIIAFGLVRVTNTILTWYGTEIATRTKSDLDDKLLPLLRRVVTAVIFVLAAMFILLTFIPLEKFSPLLAGLGIGGLAVALALQPTLTNFLAGTYVMSDALIHKGDYIMLDSGQEGTVEDIGWRTTRLRHWQGNLVIMPNSKLSDAVVTHFEKPDRSMVFSLDCGVSYDSDLEQVERITIKVAKEVLHGIPEGVPDFEPVVRFKQFGDSNIIFSIVLKSSDRAGHFVVKHEFIKVLHRRFRQEGIDIQYPVRKLVFANGLEVGAKN